MEITKASELLRLSYAEAPEKGKATSVHLFGIRYADEIDGMPLGEVAEGAGIPKSYGTEIRKGINLARYVDLKS